MGWLVGRGIVASVGGRMVGRSGVSVRSSITSALVAGAALLLFFAHAVDLVGSSSLDQLIIVNVTIEIQ